MAGGSRGPQVLRLLLAFLTISAGRSDALAQPEAQAVPERRARLVYVVAPDAEACPSAQELRAAANARAGHELFGEPASLTLQVTIRRDGAAHVATVVLPDAPGGNGAVRELRSDVGCAELATAVALVASIAIDPASILGPPAAPAPTPPPAPHIWRRFVGMGPRAAWGPGPLSGGLALSGGVAGARGTLGLELRGLAPRDVEYANGKVTVIPVTLAVVPCASHGPWEACGIAALGFVRGGGAGFTQDFSAWKAFGGLGARGGLVVGGDRLKLRAFAEAAAVFPRTTFLVGETGAYTTRGVSLTAGVDGLLFF